MVSLEKPYSRVLSQVPITCADVRSTASSQFTSVLLLLPELSISKEVKVTMATTPRISLGFIGSMNCLFKFGYVFIYFNNVEKQDKPDDQAHSQHDKYKVIRGHKLYKLRSLFYTFHAFPFTGVTLSQRVNGG